MTFYKVFVVFFKFEILLEININLNNCAHSAYVLYFKVKLCLFSGTAFHLEKGFSRNWEIKGFLINPLLILNKPEHSNQRAFELSRVPTILGS